MNRIVGIGANVYDTLIILPHYPKEDTKLKIESLKPSGGGPCATGLVAAAKLGGNVSYIGNVSSDDKGQFLIDDFKKYNVNTRHIKVFSGYNAFTSYVMLNKENSTRTIVFDKGNLPPLELNNDDISLIKNADVLLIDGNELIATINAAKAAKENNTKVLYDAGGLYEGIEKILPYVDILIPSEEFALEFTKSNHATDAIIKLYEQYHPEIVVITQGKKGGIIYDGKEIKKYDIFDLEVVDSNGAGDVFHGAFAFFVTIGFDYYKCCVYSSAVSSLKCTKIGSREAVPTYDEVINLLNKTKVEIGY